MEILTRLLWAVLPSLLCGVVMFFFQKGQKARDDKEDKRHALREKESLLQLKMELANGKMSYAVAMALKRGETNGEVEEGITAYNEALRDYNDFVNEQHVKTLEEARG